MNDTTLQLTVERFRAIASADIRLDEITVLAGINASGKSTLAHLFHSLINLNAIYPTSLESYYWEKLSRTVDATEELRWQIDHPGESRSATDRYSGRIFKPQLHVKSFETLLSEFDRFQTGALDLCRSRLSSDDVRRAYSAFAREIKADIESAFSDLEQPSPAQIKAFISAKIGETLEAYGKAKTDRSYVAFLHGDSRSRSLLWGNGKISLAEGGSIVYATDFGSSDVSSDESVNSHCVTSPLKPLYGVTRSVYIESPWMSMPLVREGGLLDLHDGFPALKRSGKEFDESLFSVLSGKLESIERPMDALDKIFAAAISGFKWMYTRKDGKSFELESCATGIRSLAILNAYYQWGILDSKTLLIIDEPEAHLHPQWIVEYAKILVKLVKKLNVRLLITTHSPYMIRALRNVSAAELTQSKIAFYLAEQGKGYQFTYRATGPDIAPIFKVFNVALDEIASYQED